MPAAWMHQVDNVEVGGYEDWKTASDHRPLVIDIDFSAAVRPAV
jgi:endonuclease/exonuclease/phosphatase family metal-dependent hydrolase